MVGVRIEETDVLVIGAGSAGLRAAIEAKRLGARVILLSKTRAGLGSCSAYAGGGLQAPVGSLTPEEHFRRAVMGGKFVNNQRLLEVISYEAERRLLELRDFGVDLELGDGRASVKGPFMLHGTGLTLPMARFVSTAGVQILEDVIAVTLLVTDGAVAGAAALNRRNGELTAYRAKSTILATGGAGQIYSRTDTPTGTTGEGYATAYQAGATLVDMEFVQFYPFGLVEAGLPMFLLDAGVVEMGRVVNIDDEEFLTAEGYRPGRDYIQQRDALSRIIATEISEGRGDQGAVLLDLSEPKDSEWSSREALDELKQRWFRNVDLTKRRLHIAPLVHYFMGGLDVDESCRTVVSGLYAAGEVVGGIDGANRMGGNALTMTLVHGARAGRAAAEEAKKKTLMSLDHSELHKIEANWRELRQTAGQRGVRPLDLKNRLRNVMIEHAGVVRSRKSLKETLRKISELCQGFGKVNVESPRQLSEAVELKGMLLVAEMITRSALRRTESRGAHYRIDFPKEEDAWLKNIHIRHSPVGMELDTTDAVMSRIMP